MRLLLDGGKPKTPPNTLEQLLQLAETSDDPQLKELAGDTVELFRSMADQMCAQLMKLQEERETAADVAREAQHWIDRVIIGQGSGPGRRQVNQADFEAAAKIRRRRVL